MILAFAFLDCVYFWLIEELMLRIVLRMRIVKFQVRPDVRLSGL